MILFWGPGNSFATNTSIYCSRELPGAPYMSEDAGNMRDNTADHRWWSARISTCAYRTFVVALMSGAMVVWGIFLWWLISRFSW